jgi:hypothetical protein
VRWSRNGSAAVHNANGKVKTIKLVTAAGASRLGRGRHHPRCRDYERTLLLSDNAVFHSEPTFSCPDDQKLLTMET